MKTTPRRCAIGTILVVAVALSGCSSNEHSERESFPFTGSSINVVNDNANMPVTVASTDVDMGEGGQVIVEVQTSTLGKSTKTPGWSLADETLNLDTPCGTSWVGYCEGSFSIQVPGEVEVSVNGRPVAVD